jgi:hypothetical protein
MILDEAAAALEAQQARIAELEAELADVAIPSPYCEICGSCGSEGCGCEHKCKYAHSHPDVVRDMDALQALVDRYEKALRPFAEVAQCDIGEDEADADLFKPMSERNARAPLLKVGDLRRAAFSIDDAAAENGQDGEPDEVLVDVAASLAAAISLLERGGRKASPSDKMFEHMLSDYRGSLSRARQALSSQGRHEGGEDSSSRSQPCGVGPSDLTDPQFQHSDGGRDDA